MGKSLGQVAYEAYLADQLTRLHQSGHSLDDWSETGDHDAWQSAAEAVAQYCAWNPNAAERAVIEAAKALHAAMIQSYDGEPVPLAVMVEFKTAIEALQEVEGGL